MAQRIEERDQRRASLDQLQIFLETERTQAKKVYAELQILLTILLSPSLEEFAAAIPHSRPACT